MSGGKVSYITRTCLFGMGGASEVRTVFVQFYLEHIASTSTVDSGLEILNIHIVGLLTTVGLSLGSLVEPSLLSDRYSWVLVSVSVPLKT